MDTDKWIAFRTARTEPKLRLFCLPYAGGGASLFKSWAQALPQGIEVCPLELPGRGVRLGELPTTDLRVLVGDMARGIESLLDMPFAIFGASLGGIVGFELARELRRRVREPAMLLVASQNAPRVVSQRNRSGAAPRRHLLSEEDFNAMLRRGGRVSESVIKNPRFMRVFGPIIRADHALVDTYEYEAEEPLRCPLFMMLGEEDVNLSEEDTAGWRAETSGGFSTRYFPGGHFFFEEDVEQLLGAVSGALHGLA